MTAGSRDSDWLADFQRRFSTMLRTPLDRSSGTLEAAHGRYDAALVAAVTAGPRARPHERLAVYNRQYWFRLFGVLHGAFPLTTRLLGHWTLNEYAARYFLAHPPSHWDIDAAATGFDAFLAGALPLPVTPLSPSGKINVETAAVCEAVAIDAAFRGLFSAPWLTPFRPEIADAAKLLGSRLRRSPSAIVIEERWPLVRLRDDLAADAGEAPVPLPPRLPAKQSWALLRQPRGTARLPLEGREAELLALLLQHSVGEALGKLEADCSTEERAELPAKVQRWLARSVDLGFWRGADQ